MIHDFTVFVGPAPGRKGDPNRPLEGAVGRKLSFLLRIPYEEYLEYQRENLLKEFPGKSGKGDAFDLGMARAQAILIMERHRKFVLLGQNVANAFAVRWNPLETFDTGYRKFFMLPHPSGINVWWNSKESSSRASLKLREFIFGKVP